MKSLVNKLSLFCLLATSAAPMHGNWLTKIGHGIGNSVSSTFNRAIWRTQLFWHTTCLRNRTYAQATVRNALDTVRVNKTIWFLQRDPNILGTLTYARGKPIAATTILTALANSNRLNTRILLQAGIPVSKAPLNEELATILVMETMAFAGDFKK